MKEFTYVITDAEGLHARPAGELVKKASTFACDVKISKDGREVDATRIMGLMSLGVKCGMEVTVKTDGEGEDLAIEELKAFFEANL